MGILWAIFLWFLAAMIIDWWDMSRNVTNYKRKKKENDKKEKSD
jgi:hypothetical protein